MALAGNELAVLRGNRVEVFNLLRGSLLAYAWTSGSSGVARFVTTRQVDLALGRPV